MKALASTLAILPIIAASNQAIAQGAWHKVAPITYTALAKQSTTTIVATSSHGSLYNSTNNGYTWSEQVIADTETLIDLAFADSLHGVIVEAFGHVRFTTDGGASWITTVIPSPLLRVAYPRPDYCFVTDYHGKIWRTTDRGEHWSSDSLAKYWFGSICFTDQLHGYVGGIGQDFFVTQDGGQSWVRKGFAFAGDSLSISDIDFWDSSHGVAASWGYLWTTDDAGVTWTLRYTPANWHSHLNTVTMTGPSSFFAMGSTNQSYCSNDLGATIAVSTVPNGDPSAEASGSVYIAGQGATIVGNSSLVYHSTDGLNWSKYSDCPEYPELVGEASGSSVALVPHLNTVGNGNAFLRSVDSGATWLVKGLRPVHFDDMDNLAGVHFVSRDTGLLFSGYNMANTEITTNGGVSWDTLGLTPFPGMKQVHFSGDDGYGCSDNRFYATHDGGFSWRVDSLRDLGLPFYSDAKPWIATLRSPFALSSTVGYALGFVIDTGSANFKYHTSLYRTTDGGARWAWLSNPPVTFGWALAFRTPEHGVVGGTDGKQGALYTTRDGGLSWTSEPIPTKSTVKAVGYYSDSLLFAGTDGKDRIMIISSTDEGLSWANDRLPFTPTADAFIVTNFLFPDTNTVLALTSKGIYRKSLDTQEARRSVEIGRASAPHGREQVLVYPNPSSSRVSCQLHGFSLQSADFRISLLDISGREIRDLTETARNSTDASLSQFTFNTGGLASGTYVLRIMQGTTLDERTIQILK